MEPDADLDALLTDLARWAADARVEDAADARSREAWLRRQAEEEARFTGLVLDLAEQGAPVAVRTTAGRQHRGVVAAVADDFLVLYGTGGRPVLLPYRAIAVVRATSGAHGTATARPAPLRTRLVYLLAGLAGDRPRVVVVVDGDETISGELRSAGVDVVALRLEGNPQAMVHVRIEAVVEVTLLG